jgi:hypothetical protein
MSGSLDADGWVHAGGYGDSYDGNVKDGWEVSKEASASFLKKRSKKLLFAAGVGGWGCKIPG